MQTKPVQKFRAGAVSCALWENELRVNGGSRTVKTLKATLERRYKDPATGEWKSSGSLARNEIPLAIWCLQKAFDHMIEHAPDRNDEGGIDDDTVV